MWSAFAVLVGVRPKASKKQGRPAPESVLKWDPGVNCRKGWMPWRGELRPVHGSPHCLQQLHSSEPRSPACARAKPPRHSTPRVKPLPSSSACPLPAAAGVTRGCQQKQLLGALQRNCPIEFFKLNLFIIYTLPASKKDLRQFTINDT